MTLFSNSKEANGKVTLKYSAASEKHRLIKNMLV